MENCLDEIENKIDDVKKILYEWNELYNVAYKKLNQLQDYVDSIKKLN